MTNTLRKILTTGTFGLSTLAFAGCADPKIKEFKDLTGDGIRDLMIETKSGFDHERWLFIGQADSTYVRAYEYSDSGVKYFKTDNGKIYFFDGTFYRESPKINDEELNLERTQ